MRLISEIKILRRKYHLTQKELANLSGVSQSLIAKIEAGTMDPTFTKAKKIFDALHDVEDKKELKAKAVMHSKVIFANSSDSVKDIIKIMKKKGISQVPVLSREKVVGIISETTILKSLAEHPEKINLLKAKDVMDDVPPIVSEKMGIKTLMELLRNYQILLVAEKGDVKGVISKSDLLGKLE